MPAPEPTQAEPPTPHGGRWLLVAQVAYLGLGYLLVVGLGRALSTQEFGWYAIVITIVTWANIVMAYGVPPVATAAMAADPAAAPGVWRGALRVQLVAAVGGFAIVAALAPAIASLLREPELVVPLVLGAAAMPGVALMLLQLGRLAAGLSFGRQAVAQVVWNATRTGAAVACAVVGGLSAALAAIALAAAPGIVVAGRSGLPRARSAPLGPIARAALAAGAASLVVFVLAGFDLLVVGRMLPDETGLYAAAQNLARIPFVLATAAAAIMLPVAAQRIPAARRVAGAWELALLVVLVPAVVVAADPTGVLELVFGDRFADGGPVAAILIWAQALLGLVAVGVAYLVGRGHRARAALLVAIALLVGLAAIVPLVRADDARGAALATLLAAVVAALLGLVALARDAGRPLAGVRLIRVAAVALVCGAIAVIAPGPVVGIAAAAIAAALLMRLLGLPPFADGPARR